MDSSGETIFALATAMPSSKGSGIAIVRLSGPEAFEIAWKLSSDMPIEIRQFRVCHLIHKGNEIDTGGVLYFEGPRSYTGEDVVEFHIHGGISVIRAMERALLDLGARPAGPGEFTRRAFLNGRLDLVQAESIAALMSAQGEASRREAIRQRSGALSERLKEMRSRLHDLLGRLEVVFDYPDEKIENMPSSAAIDNIKTIHSEIKKLLDSFGKAQLLKGIRLAIIGRPNVGKSSLLNALLMEDRAIVTPQPGTTRDVISATLSIGGIPIELLDTAGIRAVKDLDSPEAEGIRRSWREVERAHIVLLVLDLAVPLSKEDSELLAQTRERTRDAGNAILLVGNKIDLPLACDAAVVGPMMQTDLACVGVSAKTGEGLDHLQSKVIEILALEVGPDEILLTETRHKALLEEAEGILYRVARDLEKELPMDVAAMELLGR